MGDSLPKLASWTDSIDAFSDEAQWKTAVEQMRILKKEITEVGNEWAVFQGEDAWIVSNNFRRVPRYPLISTDWPQADHHGCRYLL